MESSLEIEKPKPPIVVIDDNPEALQMMSLAINEWLPGHEVILTDKVFQTQEYQATEIVNKLSRPTLLLVDFHLPGINGLDLIGKLRKYAMVPVEPVLVTGDDSEELHARAHRMGIDTFYKFQPYKKGYIGKTYHFGNLFASKIEFAEGRLANMVEKSVDDITDVYTKSELRRQWVQMRNRMIRDKYWAACLFVDVNDFKTFNNRYKNHEPGDKVLRAIKEALCLHLRTTDLIGRMGDEYIILLLVKIDPLKEDGKNKAYEEMYEEAMRQMNEIAQRIREGVDQLKVEVLPGIVETSSVSVGVAVLTPWELSDDPFRDYAVLQERADKGSYEDKIGRYRRLAESGDEVGKRKYEQYTEELPSNSSGEPS